MNMLPYSGIPALPKNIEDMHAQLVTLGLNDVEALTARIKKCEDWVDNVEETELTDNPVVFQNALAVPAASLEATIEPIQDLHGYDHPWAGGADLQQLPPEIGIVAGDESITITENSDGSYTITASETVESTIVNDAAISLPAGDYAINAFNTAKEAQIYIMDSVSAVVGNISLDTANVSGIFTSANAITKFRLRLLSGFSGSLTIKPMIVTGLTAPTSYYPYSNICPISGRDSVVVDDVGKNQLPKYTNSSYTNSGITFTQDENGVITANGTATATVVFRQLFNFKGGRYILSGGVSNNNFVGIQRTDLLYVAQSLATESAAFDLPEGQYYKAVRIGNGETVNNIKFYPMIRDASISNSTYVPYALSSVTIQLGQTVYGGQVDFKTGVVTVDRATVTLNGTESWAKSSNTQIDVFMLYSEDYGWNLDSADNILSAFKYYPTQNTDQIGAAWKGSSDYQMRFGFTVGGTTTLDQFKTWLSNNNVQLCYKLATPTELTLTPAQLQMLKGYNSVSSDDASSLTVTAYTGGPWEPITRAIKKVTNKTKTTKKRRK